MPRRLLREPHVLAHELRTPLAILAGWYSLARDGDISRMDTPEQWEGAMLACQRAIDRLNFIINQACDEASNLRWPKHGEAGDQRSAQLVEDATAAIARSRELLSKLEHSIAVERSRRARQATPSF